MAEPDARIRGIRGEPKRPPRRLTVEVVKSLQPSAREYVVWDTEVRRFGVRVYTTGARLYVLRLRVGGRQRWITIGRHGDPWTPDTARTKALELLGKAAQGKDPVHERDTGKATPTLAEFAQRYLSEYAAPHKKPATLTADLSLLGLDEAPAGSTHRWIRNDNKRAILEALGPVRIDVIGRRAITRTGAVSLSALLGGAFTPLRPVLLHGIAVDAVR